MKTAVGLWMVFALPLACMACSANSKSGGYGGGTPGGGGTGGEPQDAAVIVPDSSTGGSGGTAWNVDSGPQDAEPLGDGEACSATSQAAEPYPLDMYVMMDQSGSMSDPAGLLPTSPTKWKAVAAAFNSFMQNTTSTGLSMGIQYFPLPVVPWSQFAACASSDPQCPNNGVCLTTASSTICTGACTTSADCGPGQECVVSTSGYCNNDSCDYAVYETPEVEIAALPGVAPAISASLAQHGPMTNTPSAPALHGAIEHARQWATAHADHTTIVVFATDGMPSVCPADGTEAQLVNLTKQSAQGGLNGTPPVKTFVIGVVTPGDMFSTNNLNAIAQSGGTGQAFILNPNQDLTTQFSQALEAIRGATMNCEFKIPDTGTALDYGKVNVTYTAANTQKYPVYYVASEAACNPTDGGWYYDVDPSAGTPTKILLCPQSCAFIQSYGGSISIELGCKTQTGPK